jgi:hypothetical protein
LRELLASVRFGRARRCRRPGPRRARRGEDERSLRGRDEESGEGLADEGLAGRVDLEGEGGEQFVMMRANGDRTTPRIRVVLDWWRTLEACLGAEP